MKVTQEMRIELPGREAVFVQITRYPNGSGFVWDYCYRFLSMEESFENDGKDTKYFKLSDSEKDYVLEIANKEWDGYWTCDPRCAQGWTQWRHGQMIAEIMKS